MALKLYERYPQLWESPSNDYPQGAFKNLSAQGETDGSYLEKDWLNDYSGFFGALLRNAEMTPDGTVDTAQKSQFYDALVKVAKESVDLSAYRKKDDLLFNGTLKVQATDDAAAGVFLQDTDGTVRGQVVAADQGLQLTQYPKDGGSQTFTFPSEGGELLNHNTGEVVSEFEELPVDLSILENKTIKLKGVKFRVVKDHSVLDTANLYNFEHNGYYLEAVDLYTSDFLGNTSSDYQIINIPHKITSQQNSIYDEKDGLLILMCTDKEDGSEVGSLAVFKNNGGTFDYEYSILGIPAGHFSYTALRRDSNDNLWVYHQHYNDKSPSRGIGRTLIHPTESRTELLLPEIITDGSGHSSIRFGRLDSENIWIDIHNKRHTLSFSDIDSSELNLKEYVGNDISIHTSSYYYQTEYQSLNNTLLVTGLYTSKNRNLADAGLVTVVDNVCGFYDLTYDFKSAVDWCEPQSLFSVFNKDRGDYDIYLCNTATDNNVYIFKINEVGNGKTSHSGNILKNSWEDYRGKTPPTLELKQRSLKTQGLFIGSNNDLYYDKPCPADSRNFVITQVFGDVGINDPEYRMLGEIVAGKEADTVMGFVDRYDTARAVGINISTYEGVQVAHFNSKFGHVLTSTGFITANQYKNGRVGIHEKTGYTATNTNVGFLTDSLSASFVSYNQKLDYATSSEYQGLKFGYVSLPPESKEVLPEHTHEWVRMTKDSVIPKITKNLGTSTERWDNIYLSNQPSVSSDARIKQNIKPIEEKYFEVLSNIEFKQYNMSEDDKTNFGIIAQDWIKACEANGVDPYESSILDGNSEDGYAIRYGELQILINAYILHKLNL